MKKIFVFCFVIVLLLLNAALADSNINKDIRLRNKLFEITLPQNFKGSFISKKEKDKISIFDKDSKKAGFGGFAFGIKAYKNPSDHATLPGSKKIGELVDKKGLLYDMVIKYPTDVQYDYTKGINPPLLYKNLYDYGKLVNINGINGSTYYKKQGMKGQNLYSEILKKHIVAIKEKWDSNKLEQENMSYMYNVVSQGENSLIALDRIGYAYYDVNVDGIDELLIGEIADGEWKGVIYDIYTMVNRKPKHVVSGGERNRFYVCDDSFLCNEYSSGVNESGVRVYALVENSTEIFPQVNFKYDGYENEIKPWFISYGNYDDAKWTNVDEATFNERKKIFEKYVRFDFVPLRNFKY